MLSYIKKFGFNTNKINIYFQRAWATVSRKNQNISSHDHPQSHISFAYYLKKSKLDGGITFIDNHKHNEFIKNSFGSNLHKGLFGIVQGGLYNDLRLECLEKLIEIDFDGFALGGLAVGETQDQMFNTLDAVKDYMPRDKPRYLMGVGTPSDILGAVKRGIDMFDCVLPTRSGRTGSAFTWNGRINIKNSKYQNDNSPLDDKVELCDLNKYSKNYLNHLFNTNEILGSMLLTIHNINFYQQLMKQIRETITNGTFDVFHDRYINVI